MSDEELFARDQLRRRSEKAEKIRDEFYDRIKVLQGEREGLVNEIERLEVAVFWAIEIIKNALEQPENCGWEFNEEGRNFLDMYDGWEDE